MLLQDKNLYTTSKTLFVNVMHNSIWWRTEKFLGWKVPWLKSSSAEKFLAEKLIWWHHTCSGWYFLPMESKHCNPDGWNVWTSKETMLKNKPLLVTLHKSIFVSLWTFQLTFVYLFTNSKFGTRPQLWSIHKNWTHYNWTSKLICETSLLTIVQW